MLRRTVITYLRQLLALDESPERIALAFALGVAISFSPLLGLQTILGLAIAVLFKLNRMAMLIGLFINNPWTLVPIYAAANYVGGLLIGFPSAASLPDFGWGRLLHASYWIDLMSQWRLLMPLLVGSTVLSVLCAFLSYPLALYLIRQRRSTLPD